MSSSTGGEVGSWISRSFGFSVMLWLKVVLVSSVSMCCLMARVFAASRLPQDEVNVLNQIAKTMGATDWSFKDDACEHYNTIRGSQRDPERSITCVNGLENDTSHVRAIKFKRFSLPGVLPPQLPQLPYIEEIDFAYNYLNGSIPTEWASMQLKFISLFGNRLSGNIPFLLGNITSLTYLDLEANQFSGTVPPELGKLVNLETLRLSSNQLSGNLPTQLAELKNISDLRINDNNFNGSIPDFIQNWKKLNRLEMQASGLEGPIPSSISVLDNLTQLRISDISAVSQPFPALVNMTSLRQMTLKNCSISGEIPTYIWGLNSLKVLDLSFNKLHGKLPNSSIGDHLELILLSNNSLNGNISESILRRGVDLDLSYNNFTQQSSNQPACQRRMNSNVNLFKSSLMENNLNGVLPCMSGFKCPKYWQSFHINCGGDTVHVNGTTYEGDGGQDGGSAKLYVNDDSNWGFSSTGDYKDDGDLSNSRFIYNSPSQNISGLYSTARVSPLSLTYFGYCLENGDYTVTLHFAEIGLTNDDPYSSLGRRLFDIYIQGKLVEKDFNIEAEARGAFKPVTKPVNASVTNNILEIRFIWAGKGTTSIPVGGVHGPLVSAISVDSNSKTHSGGSIKIAPIVGGVVGVCLLCLALGILWWRCYHRPESGRQKDFEGLDIQISSFTLKQIKAATNNFDPVNKIGEGGFGPVFKGQLSDGTVVAVKQLSSKSRQGNREFLNEMGMISCLQHPNLVKLHGCCIEGDQLLLVYEYMENNSLARALYGQQNCQLKLDWPTRHKICIGIARGLAFLHEESRLKIVHRDIKATNVLLDRDLSPKISDFGLAKLDEEGNTHISTRIAGTIGYMAPEYALWGYLTYKADVYSFGVVALEIVSGKHNMSCTPENDCACLLDWACQLQRSGKLMELVDQKLGFQFSKEEAERMIKTALVCTNASASLRPSMSEVVGMLEGTTGIPDLVPEASSYSEDLRFKPIRDHHRQMHSERLRGNKAPHPSSTGSGQGTSSASAHEHHEIKQETNLQVLNVESQISTSVPSWNGSSSNSANNLNCHTV